MRKRISRKLARGWLGTRNALRLARFTWVYQQFSVLLVLWFVAPVCFLAVLAPPDVGRIIIPVVTAPLVGLLILLALASMGIGAGLVSRLEELLNKACQLNVVGLESGEQIRLTSYEKTAGLWPRHGQLTLTNRRLLFRRPRWWFMPPWRPMPTLEIRLPEIAVIDAEPPTIGLRVFRLRGLRSKLSLRLVDGSKYEFTSMMARAWRRQILRARRKAS